MLEWLLFAAITLAVLLLIDRAMRRDEGRDLDAPAELMSGPEPVSAGPVFVGTPEWGRGP
jgi:hypothetical protein